MNFVPTTNRNAAALHQPPLPPGSGKSIEVVPGVRWVRIGLPIALDHINLWALEDGAGWTIVDTGIQHAGGIQAWEHILENDLGGRPVTRVIVTHMHADHAGLAGWLVRRFNCQLWMTRAEYLSAKALVASTGEEPAFHDLYQKAGWEHAEIVALGARRRTIAGFYSPLPDSFRRLRNDNELVIGGKRWIVSTGGGHSPEHACLYCPELELFISGDKVLPGISSNISVDPSEPDGDPLGEWFDTLAAIRAQVPDNVLVLPSHGRCFTGLHARIAELVEEQREVLKQLRSALDRPRRAIDVFDVLFKRAISRSNIPLMGLATGEALAVLNHLVAASAVQRRMGTDGVMLYESVRGLSA